MAEHILPNPAKPEGLSWKLQRIAWASWLALLLVAILGIYGHGLFIRESLAMDTGRAGDVHIWRGEPTNIVVSERAGILRR